MKLQFNEGFGRAWRIAFCGAFALLLVIGCPPSGRGQQAAPPSGPAATAPEKPAVSPQPPSGIPALLEHPQEALRKGLLFYATSPLPEQALERLDKTSTPFSVTVPLEVDRKKNSLFVSARINDRQVRLLLDTGGPWGVSLNEAAAKGLKLKSQFPIVVGGTQGDEPMTEGLADSMTLGKLMLKAIIILLEHDTPGYNNKCTLGTKMFERYRVTLDLAAKTMTLARGGVPVAVPAGETSLSVPFRYEDGLIFVPVRFLNQPTWAMLDSGSDTNDLSLGLAKLAAAQLPPPGAVSRTLDQKIGTGGTHNGFTIMVLAIPAPIFLNTGQDDPRRDLFNFGTTSQAGFSFMEDEFDSYHSVPTGVTLGLPFILQFRRVIIDYPNHMLILQGPEHGPPVNIVGSTPGKPWPGYQWRRVGDGWVEVPDGKSAPVPPLPLANSQTTVTQTTSTTTTTKDGTTTTVVTKDGTTTATSTAGLHVVVSPPSNGSITVSVNGTKSVYPFPPGSTVKVNNDGSILILPPGSTAKDEKDGSVTITRGK